jgi:hypothetical protein
MDIIQADIKKMESTLSLELDVTAYMASEITVSMTILDDITQLEQDIESLLHGQMTPRLISFAQIDAMLSNATIELNRFGLIFCLRTPQAVYANPNFEITRHDSDIFIRLTPRCSASTCCMKVNQWKPNMSTGHCSVTIYHVR